MQEYVATTESGWGRGFNETDAVANAIANSQFPSEDMELAVWRVVGFENVFPFEVYAREVLSEERFTVRAEDAETVWAKAGQLDLDVETMLVNGQ